MQSVVVVDSPFRCQEIVNSVAGQKQVIANDSDGNQYDSSFSHSGAAVSWNCRLSELTRVVIHQVHSYRRTREKYSRSA